jgi:hypothetical protein
MSEKATFHVGDRVRFLFGTQKVTGTVKEDRGPIGVKGRRLYLVHVVMEPPSTEIVRIELPAEDLELVRAPASPQGKQ